MEDYTDGLPLYESDTRTVAEARLELWDCVEEGVKCPVCDQLAKKWLIKLHAGMAYWLLLLVRRFEAGEIWISVKEHNTKAGMRGGDYAKLRHWGLVAQATNKDIEKRASGYWQPTLRGIDFVHGRCTLPRAVWTYDNEPLEFTTERTTIQEALGDKFNYEELMKPVPYEGE